MIGNDVVDLRLARVESNWKRRGYLEKLFTQTERLAIATAADAEVCLWILWSMKEAAYKIYNRETGIRAYIPFKLECSLHSLSKSHASGTVVCGEHSCFTLTSIDNDIIHTVAVRISEFDRKVQYINETISKDELGRPFIYHAGSMLPVSKSHHGRSTIAVGLL